MNNHIETWSVLNLSIVPEFEVCPDQYTQALQQTIQYKVKGTQQFVRLSSHHFFDKKLSQNYGQLREGRDLEGRKAEETWSVSRGEKKG